MNNGMANIEIPPLVRSFQMGEHVGIINHFEPELGIRWRGVVVGLDQDGDQYYGVMPDNPDRAGRRLEHCEDKEDIRKLI